MKLSIILSIIKDKDKMPAEEFDRLMSIASVELNTLGYHPDAMGGIDFKMVEDLSKANKEIESLKITQGLLVNANKTWAAAFSTLSDKNYTLISELEALKNTIKVKLITLIKEL